MVESEPDVLLANTSTSPKSPKNRDKLLILSFIFISAILIISLIQNYQQLKNFINSFSYKTLPPIRKSTVKPEVIRKVNKAAKTGEFLLPDYSKPQPTPLLDNASLFSVEGIYNLSNNVEAKVSRSIPQNGLNDTSEYVPDLENRYHYWLTFKLTQNDKIIFSSILPIVPSKDAKEISFKVALPYHSNVILKIVDQNNKELFRENINL